MQAAAERRNVYDTLAGENIVKNITKLPEELLPERLMFMENNNEIKNNLVVVCLACCQ